MIKFSKQWRRKSQHDHITEDRDQLEGAARSFSGAPMASAVKP